VTTAAPSAAPQPAQSSNGNSGGAGTAVTAGTGTAGTGAAGAGGAGTAGGTGTTAAPYTYNKSDDHTGAVIGIVAGCVAILCACGCGVAYYFFRSSQSQPGKVTPIQIAPGAWEAPAQKAGGTSSSLQSASKTRIRAAEKGDEVVTDTPGMYTIMAAASRVGDVIALENTQVGLLKQGDEVEVIEVKRLETVPRIRARLRKPSGWITLVNTETGERFAEMKAKTTNRLGTPLPPQPLPAIWTNQDAGMDFSQLVTVEALVPDFQELLTATYKQVKTKDRGDHQMPTRLEVVSVMHNENRQLWQRYSEAKVALRDARSHRCTPLEKLNGGVSKTMAHLKAQSSPLSKGFDQSVNEALLFHGTSPSGMAAIAKEGFSLNFAGSFAGTMYGPGAYFAECSSKSDEYGRDEKDGIYSGLNCLLLCRVLLGEMMVIQVGGNSVHDVIKAAMESNAFNSILGDRQAAVGTYREFVVYKEDQVYPEYAIIYKRKYD
jgi:hypothetical protein